MATPNAPTPLDRTIKRLHRALHARVPDLQWVDERNFHSLFGWVLVEGVEMAALRASLYMDIDSRLRHGLLRRLALGMESHPPRTMRDALAFACAALVELDRIETEGGLSRFDLADGARRVRPAFRGAKLPEWKPILPYCAGGYGDGPYPSLHAEQDP